VNLASHVSFHVDIPSAGTLLIYGKFWILQSLQVPILTCLSISVACDSRRRKASLYVTQATGFSSAYLRANPITARGKPYVSMMADHSEPGKIVKYAPNPYDSNAVPTVRPMVPNDVFVMEISVSGTVSFEEGTALVST
jgi:hypothetical protein